MKINVGSKVRQVVPTIEGEVRDAQLNKSTGGIEYLVGWVDEGGEAHERWFAESEIVEIKKGAK